MSLYNFISLANYLLSIPINIKTETQSIYSLSCRQISFIVPSTITTKKIFSKNNYNNNKYRNLTQVLLATESAYRFTKMNDTKLNLFQQLVNKYWQQTIFLSESTPLSNKYIYQQSKTDSIIKRHEHKKFLISFSKALLSGRIDSRTFVYTNNNFSPYVQYLWRKGFNFSLPGKLQNLSLKRYKKNFLNSNQVILNNILQQNNFPLFVVVNGLKQMVVAEPPEELLMNRNILNIFYQWYNDHFLLANNNNKIYEGWFFVNPNDANEYKNYIQRQYIRSSNHHNLNIFPTSLNFYYVLNRSLSSRMQFRLLPDLVEVSKLLTYNKHRNNLIFHPNQKYSKTFFQGQPIYFIQPTINIISKTNQVKKIHYYYQIPNDPLNKQYNAVFFNKEDAIYAWNKFREKMLFLDLPQQPLLLVYNLENFLKDHEIIDNTDLTNKDFLLVPSKDAYQEIKKSSKIVSTKNLSNVIAEYCSYYLVVGKIWSKRIIWSLTSRQPPHR